MFVFVQLISLLLVIRYYEIGLNSIVQVVCRVALAAVRMDRRLLKLRRDCAHLETVSSALWAMLLWLKLRYCTSIHFLFVIPKSLLLPLLLPTPLHR
jgi:hypothetical protein